MNSNESNEAPEGRAVEVPPAAIRLAASDVPEPRLGRARWLLAIGGLLAGLVSFGIGEAIYEIIPIEKVEQILYGTKMMVSNRTTYTVAATRNGALTFGVLGLCLGGVLGLVGGLARRSTSGALTGGLVGSVLGIALGAGVSLALLPHLIAMRLDHADYDLLLSLFMHGLIWGLLGAAAGLAYAVGLGNLRLSGRTMTAGLLGAFLGAVAYELLGAFFCNGAKTDEPISETWPTRLMARILVTAGTAIAIALLLPDRPKNAVEHQAKLGTATPET